MKWSNVYIKWKQLKALEYVTCTMTSVPGVDK